MIFEKQQEPSSKGSGTTDAEIVSVYKRSSLTPDKATTSGSIHEIPIEPWTDEVSSRDFSSVEGPPGDRIQEGETLTSFQDAAHGFMKTIESKWKESQKDRDARIILKRDLKMAERALAVERALDRRKVMVVIPSERNVMDNQNSGESGFSFVGNRSMVCSPERVRCLMTKALMENRTERLKHLVKCSERTLGWRVSNEKGVVSTAASMGAPVRKSFESNKSRSSQSLKRLFSRHAR